jgi:hypothetical protein
MILAIDPGLSGCIAFLRHPQGDRVLPLPTKATDRGTITQRIDAPALAALITREVGTEVIRCTVIESIAAGQGNNAMRTSSAQSVGSQYRTRGSIEATLELLGLKVTEVSPQRWKKLFGLKGGPEAKEQARQKALVLYPHLEPVLRRKSDHNAAEAVLIGHWAARTLAPEVDPENPLL